MLCPSRGRPQAAHELLASFEATTTIPTSELVFCLDSDDPTAPSYPSPVVLGEPTGDPVRPLNRAALASPAAIVGFTGDDTRFETHGWDHMVTDALRTPGFCWGDDGHDRPWPSTVFVCRELVQALGYLALPSLKRGYFDVVWIALAELTKTNRVIPAMFRHDNTVHEQPTDQTIHEDFLAYTRWFHEQYDADVRKVRSVELARFFS